MIKVNIRPFDIKKDMEDTITCYNEGFENIRWPRTGHARPSLQKDTMMYFVKMSTDLYVAEMDGEICGIIFGAAPLTIKNIISGNMQYYLNILPKALINVYGMNWIAYKHIFQTVYGFLPYAYLMPRHSPHCEVIMFTLRNKYRGRGVGRILMDKLADTVRSRGYEGMVVCTDTAVSYRFYESYGFILEKSFDLKAYRYSIPGKSFKGLIYYYKIPPKTA